MLQYVLSFVAGKDQGREFPLPPDLNIVIGRVSDVDLLLLDEKVSRKHAKIFTHNGRIGIEDLASKNGTFVNGARVRNTDIKEGDEIIIGTSKIRLVSLGETSGQSLSVTDELARRGAAGMPQATTPLIAGSIREMPLPDLLQLFNSSRKSGVLTIRSGQTVGRIYLRDGQVYSAGLEGYPTVRAYKAFYRLFTWNEGSFDLSPLAGPDVLEEITESTTSLVLEGMRQLDEMHLLESKLPQRGARLAVADPLPGSLRDLATEEIQLFQLVLHHGLLEAAIDNFPGTDFEAYTCLMGLMRRGFVTVA
jgi:pSer/pThr/pTyr-binding forkhead associated (FHA) protein